MEAYSVSVIIVTYNHWPVICESLDLLEGLDETKEVIVVDNCSSDGTADQISRQYPWVRLIRSERNGGFGYGCNKGAACARFPILYFLNPDAQTTVTDIDRLADFLMKRKQCGAAGPKIFRGESVEFSCRRFPGYSQVLFHRYSIITKLFPNNPYSQHYLMSDWDHNREKQVDWISGSALMVKREAFEAIGGFDEGYFLFCEDTDLCKRLWLAGWEVWYTPDATVQHHIGESEMASSMKMLYRRHQSIWRYSMTFHRGFFLKNFVTWCGIWTRFSLYALIFFLRKIMKFSEK